MKATYLAAEDGVDVGAVHCRSWKKGDLGASVRQWENIVTE